MMTRVGYEIINIPFDTDEYMERRTTNLHTDLVTETISRFSRRSGGEENIHQSGSSSVS
jgi:hypothetical protein